MRLESFSLKNSTVRNSLKYILHSLNKSALQIEIFLYWAVLCLNPDFSYIRDFVMWTYVEDVYEEQLYSHPETLCL